MYFYGMRLRPAGPGCQPKEGFEGIKDPSIVDRHCKYWDIIQYSRELTESERTCYDLDYVGMEIYDVYAVSKVNGLNFPVLLTDNKEEALKAADTVDASEDALIKVYEWSRSYKEFKKINSQLIDDDEFEDALEHYRTIRR